MIEWVAVADKWPPIDEMVLTFRSRGDGSGYVEQNMLSEGDGVVAQNGRIYRECGLFYWASDDDFESITHWAAMPALPNVEHNRRTADSSPGVRVDGWVGGGE